MRSPRAIDCPADNLAGCTAQPFVSSLRTDAEPAAQLPPANTPLLRKTDELTSLIHD
jgi:hypothetical protein